MLFSDDKKRFLYLDKPQINVKYEIEAKLINELFIVHLRSSRDCAFSFLVIGEVLAPFTEMNRRANPKIYNPSRLSSIIFCHVQKYLHI